MYYVNYNKHGQVNGYNRIVPTNVQVEGLVVTYEGQLSTKTIDEINRRELVSHSRIGENNTLHCESAAAAREVAKLIEANPCYARQ